MGSTAAAAAAVNMASLITAIPVSSTKLNFSDKFTSGYHFKRARAITKITAISPNGSASPSSSHGVSFCLLPFSFRAYSFIFLEFLF